MARTARHSRDGQEQSANFMHLSQVYIFSSSNALNCHENCNGWELWFVSTMKGSQTVSYLPFVPTQRWLYQKLCWTSEELNLNEWAQADVKMLRCPSWQWCWNSDSFSLLRQQQLPGKREKRKLENQNCSKGISYQFSGYPRERLI